MPLKRTILRFSVATLPAAAQMQSGTIKISITSLGLPHDRQDCVQRAPAAVFGNIADHLTGIGVPTAGVPAAIGENTYTLSAEDLAYVKSCAGGYCYFMFKDYEHDYLDTYPTTSNNHGITAYTQAGTTPPKLSLTYKA